MSDLFLDWLIEHDLNRTTLLDILTAWRAGAISGTPTHITGMADDQAQASALRLTQHECITGLVIPAFQLELKQYDLSNKILNEIECSTLDPQGVSPPHTVDRGPAEPVLIAMDWEGSPDDVICLAHEVAHALQILMSDHKQMPPLAREVCAFLGELIVIEYVRTTAPDLYPALCEVWRRENEAYLGSDLDALLTASADPRALYHYRQNYPIARLAAVELFNRSDGNRLRQFFASGREGMRDVPLEDLANRAGDFPNYLPSMPHPDRETSATEAYRSLGAMALIDIDYWEGHSQARIEEYYADLLRHLQDQTAFVTLNEQRKPVGYATWSKPAQGNEYTLTRQAAPFGDHLALQRALGRHLGDVKGVIARHNPSARQEQVAW